MNQDKNFNIELVKTMLNAFGKGDMTALLETVSEDTIWIGHGTEEIPYAGTYSGKDGVLEFFKNILTYVEILDFQVNQIIADEHTVVVLGFEKHKIKRNGEILEQKWVQVYTIENEKISRLEEFANTAYAAKLFTK